MVKTKYVCSDGAVFDDEGEASRHEKAIVTSTPLYKLIDNSGEFLSAYGLDMREEVYSFIKDNWDEITKAMGEAGTPEQRYVSYPDPPNRNCHKNCTGYDPCSDICDECRADDEDRENR